MQVCLTLWSDHWSSATISPVVLCSLLTSLLPQFICLSGVSPTSLSQPIRAVVKRWTQDICVCVQAVNESYVHKHVQMTKCGCVFVCVCVSAPASLEGNICCMVSEATCLTPSCRNTAAADQPACRTDLLSARSEAAAGRSVWGGTAVPLDRPMARHLRRFAVFAQCVA